ncbi:MAG: VOC family protein [Rhodothermales bacterium]|nr:VOC family protein [Rhodothermales bacterium]
MNPYKTHGAIAWPELATSDPEGAAEFYKSVFGWTFDVMPMQAGDYYVGKVGEAGLCGIMQVPDPSMPNAWTYYVTVDDAQATAERVTELGGTIVVPVMSVENVGTFLGIMDPTGAVIMAMQWAEMEGAPEVNFTDGFTTHGAFSWFELRTHNAEAAADFYSKLFGWTIDRQEMQMGPYMVCKIDEVAFGGIIVPPQDEVPPHWGGYVTVDDVDALNSRITDNGGTVAMARIEAEGVGTFNMFQDPPGAWLSAAKYVPMETAS